jgi:hypothetical protein
MLAGEKMHFPTTSSDMAAKREITQDSSSDTYMTISGCLPDRRQKYPGETVQGNTQSNKAATGGWG